MSESRMEKDSLGEIEVAAGAYWGAQTERARLNFPVSGLRFQRRFIAALGLIKGECAAVNGARGFVPAELAAAIERAALEVYEGKFRRAGAEALALIAYLLLLVGVGQALGLRTHLASVGLHAATHEVYHAHTAGSVVAWCAYYGVFGALLPLAYFRFGRGVSWRAMLLGFPRPSRLVPFALITAAMGIAAFAGRDYLELSIVGHLVAALVFTAGTFLPVMVLTQCLIVPRLALATGSTATAAVLGGLVYGLYHAGEFFMTWTTADAALLSACWTFQFAFFGFLKALTTLRSGSAWVHIFSTHAPHLAESPAVATVFGIR